ncbi:MAG: exopolysaccharide biosynthesis polyprenyl glycosylphosphotransferase [Oscillospiraceae bacterium]|jgi:exopolysaccharide biosynthesis polyprenyl glycosylphosphotransferase|nr:exopolysaccharide biosynthesis polyprenyl glycosylphosphotransferase [Oscillospiraceae bacterium]
MKSNDKYRNLMRLGLSVIALLIMVTVWAVFWLRFYAEDILVPFYMRGNLLLFFIYGVLQALFNSFYGGYRIGYYKRENVIYSACLALVLCNCVTYLQICLIGYSIMNPLPIIFMSTLQGIVIFAWTLFAHACYMKAFPPRKMLLVYGGEKLADDLLRKMKAYPERFDIHEAIRIDEGFEKIRKKAREYESVVLCDIPSAKRNRLLKLCLEGGIRTYITPKISDIVMRGSVEIDLFDTPLLLSRNTGLNFEQRILKRITDIVFAALGLLLLSPLMLLICAAIKLYDGGRIIYSQKRLTENGREFLLFKFRSMIEEAEENGAQLSTMKDKRITPVGRLIRSVRLDELPQLWNVIKGEMSIVGPRPERPEIAEKQMRELPEFRYRLKARAGLTGLAQVTGRYDTTAYDKLRMDLMYIMGYSLLGDFKLMLMTLKTLFMKNSSQGVADTRGDLPLKDYKPASESPETGQAL